MLRLARFLPSPAHPRGWLVSALLVCVAPAFADEHVAVSDAVQLEVAGARSVQLRVVYPRTGEIDGTVVLSHGTFSSGKRYDPVALYWAGAGFAVILPDHRDANYAEMPRSVEHMLEIVASRVGDVRAVADQLGRIESRIPELDGRLVGKPLAVAGHSVGTQVALQAAGLRFRDPRDGRVRGYDETRFAAVVLLSDPGKMAMMPDHTWRGAAVPTFMATGPDDYGLMGDGRRQADYENEVLAPEVSEPPARYELLIDGMDHQFGGLIHKDTDDPPDHDALALFNAQSTVFLRRHLAGDTAARLWAGRLSERALLNVPD